MGRRTNITVTLTAEDLAKFQSAVKAYSEAQQALAESAHRWAAQYAGVCSECDEQFDAGDLIQHAQGFGYQHVLCPETLPAPAVSVCPTCNLDHRGECF